MMFSVQVWFSCSSFDSAVFMEQEGLPRVKIHKYTFEISFDICGCRICFQEFQRLLHSGRQREENYS